MSNWDNAPRNQTMPTQKEPEIISSRRMFLQNSSALAAVSLGFIRNFDPLAANTETEQALFSATVGQYMSTYDVPAVGMAYCKGSETLFVGNYGMADRQKHIQLEAKHLFRIASVSKTITCAAIFKLLESGSLSLTQTIFGRHGLLKEYRLTARTDWLEQITVHHLLTHTSGAWPNDSHDPMRQNLHLDRPRFLQQTLEDFPMLAPPGSLYAYSNFGYFVLGRVIERCSNKPYGEFVQEVVLQPAGIHSMKLGRSKQAHDEVRYYGQGQDDPYTFPIELHDSCGGWLASPTELAHFAAAVFSAADKDGAPALLQAATIAEMTLGTTVNPEYASGWSVNPHNGDCFHGGGIDGSASFLVHTRTGVSWAIIANTRRVHSDMQKDLHRLSKDIENRL